MTHILTMNVSAVTENDYRRLYLLSDQYRRRKADRYLRQEDRIRCVCAGLLLRFALGKADFEIETAPNGKPRVKDCPDFHFNLSHSGNWVVIAYGTSPVGVDVEQIHWDSGKDNLARRFFTADEQAYVFHGHQRGRAERFFEIWTAKEGYLKYLGTGLHKALDSFSVLQLKYPNRFSFQPEDGYSLTLWTADAAYDVIEVSVAELLNALE